MERRRYLGRWFAILDFHCFVLFFKANSGTHSSYLIRFLLLPVIRSVLSNMYEMEQFLQKTEDISWTVVRPPGLKNLPASGESRQVGIMAWENIRTSELN